MDATGRGSRNWKPHQRRELLETGKVKGFYGHHIFNVKHHPYATGDPDNIKFLTFGEHLKVHGGNFRNKTQGNLVDRSF